MSIDGVVVHIILDMDLNLAEGVSKQVLTKSQANTSISTRN